MVKQEACLCKKKKKVQRYVAKNIFNSLIVFSEKKFNSIDYLILFYVKEQETFAKKGGKKKKNVSKVRNNKRHIGFTEKQFSCI